MIENQLTIRALTQPRRATPDLALRRKAVNALVQRVTLSSTSSVTLAWFPAHVGIHENEEVDQAAKAATVTGIPQDLLISLAEVKQLINSKCRASIVNQLASHIVRRLRGVHIPFHIRKALAELPQHLATAIAQLRAGHTPLSAFLHRIKAVNNPNFQECNQPETTKHFLMLCRNYVPQRKTLFDEIHLLHPHGWMQTILTNPWAFKPLADYISATERFIQERTWAPSPTQP